MDKISIIVPIYNAERYLEDCIKSLLNQTYGNIEIILVNDGSTDNSREIMNEYAKSDNRIITKHIKNSGVSTARNKGLELVTGQWITFVDSDDWVEPNMLSFAINKARDSDADIVIWSYFMNYVNKQISLSLIPGGNQVFTSNKDLLYLKSIYQLYGESSIKECVSAGTAWCKLYKNEIIKDNNLRFKAELTRAQDVVFSINAFLHAKKIVYFDKQLYHYRINDSSTCSGNRFIPDTKKPFDSLLGEFETFIVINKKGRKYYDAFNARTVQVLLWHLKHKYFHDDYSKGIFHRRKKVLTLINKEPYRTAVNDVDINILPKQEKVMIKLFRRKLILIYFYILNLYGKLGKKRKRKFI